MGQRPLSHQRESHQLGKLRASGACHGLELRRRDAGAWWTVNWFPAVPRECPPDLARVWHESFVVAPLQDQAYGAFFEPVVLLQVEVSAVLGEREQVAGQGLQSGGVRLDGRGTRVWCADIQGAY